MATKKVKSAERGGESTAQCTSLAPVGQLFFEFWELKARSRLNRKLRFKLAAHSCTNESNAKKTNEEQTKESP